MSEWKPFFTSASDEIIEKLRADNKTQAAEIKKYAALREKCFGINGYVAQHNADKHEIKRQVAEIERLEYRLKLIRGCAVDYSHESYQTVSSRIINLVDVKFQYLLPKGDTDE
jgi:hypothetical protein